MAWVPVKRVGQERRTDPRGEDQSFRVEITIKPLPDTEWSNVFFELRQEHRIVDAGGYAEWTDKAAYSITSTARTLRADIERFDAALRAANERYKVQVLPRVQAEAAKQQAADDQIKAIDDVLASMSQPRRPAAAAPARQTPPRRRSIWDSFLGR